MAQVCRGVLTGKVGSGWLTANDESVRITDQVGGFLVILRNHTPTDVSNL